MRKRARAALGAAVGRTTQGGQREGGADAGGPCGRQPGSGGGARERREGRKRVGRRQRDEGRGLLRNGSWHGRWNACGWGARKRRSPVRRGICLDSANGSENGARAAAAAAATTTTTSAGRPGATANR